MKPSLKDIPVPFAIGIFILLLVGVPAAWSQSPSDANNISIPHTRVVEDWGSLSLAGSELPPAKPILGEKDDYPLFTRDLIQVLWRSGDPIDLYVIRPKGVAKPPVVLYLYGYPSETDRFHDDDYCARVTRDGFAAVGFVSVLTGHRYANRPMKEWFVSELQESLGSTVHDVQLILNYLAGRGDLDMDRVGMFGEGSGGTIAILSAAADPRIKVIDVLDPWGDWPDWVRDSTVIPDQERPTYLKSEYLSKVAGLDPVKWLPELKSQQLRLQQVMDDPATPKAAKERMAAAVLPKMAVVVAYEDNQQLYHAVSGGRIFQWVKDQLQPTHAPPTAVVKSQAAATASQAGHDN